MKLRQTVHQFLTEYQLLDQLGGSFSNCQVLWRFAIQWALANQAEEWILERSKQWNITELVDLRKNDNYYPWVSCRSSSRCCSRSNGTSIVVVEVVVVVIFTINVGTIKCTLETVGRQQVSKHSTATKFKFTSLRPVLLSLKYHTVHSWQKYLFVEYFI